MIILARKIKVEMKGERDIAILSGPFAAGVVSGAAILALPVMQNAVGTVYVFAGVAALLVVLLLGLLWSNARPAAPGDGAVGPDGIRAERRAAGIRVRLRERLRGPAAVAILFGLLGCFCALTDAAGDSAAEDAAPEWAERAAAALRRTADAVPYPSPATGPLVKALTTGDRSGLDRETVQVFRRSGASHLLALSGLHLGILYMLLLRITALFGNRPAVRRTRGLLLIVLSGLYALVTGASPSIVRAFLFILLGETARLLGRPQPPLRIFCGALLLQLALNPSVIATVGFQLSYLAMAGIYLLFPRLRAWYPSEGPSADRRNLPRRMWELMALTLSCQAFTAPLAWFYFRTFPKYFLLTNLLAMPLTTGLMLLSVTVLALTALGCCPAVLIALNDRAATLLLHVLGIIASM